MITSILILTLLGISLGILLGAAASYFAVEGNPLEEEIESMLPGSQCGQCGFPGCTRAAAALVNGEADVTICPPGGRSLAMELANKLGISTDLSDMEDKELLIARIHSELCIGCTKCFKRCPTDAIVGSSKQIHAVISDACTGCEKCFEVCPTECIEMRPIPVTLQNWHWPNPAVAV
ncbi:MAG: RnfABCDGE type electron transport complex subunit B [Gammaproteobacteria bacterium]|jgi:electron transport complex protein RnfB